MHKNSQLSYPRVCGLLGESPSRFSQAMHNAGFQHLQLPFVYAAFATRKTEVALTAMREMGMRGFSLTIPHKERAMTLVDSFSDEASSIGAINTVINDGRSLRGHNTDWFGIESALQEAGFDAAGKTALLLGAGGAARAAVYALQRAGIFKLYVCNRSDNRAADLAAQFSCEYLPYEELPNFDFAELALLINSTPIGMNVSEALHAFAWESLHAELTVFEMVTKQTLLLQEAAARGARTIAGVRMLLFQALQQFELFAEYPAPFAVMEAALEREIHSAAQANSPKG